MSNTKIVLEKHGLKILLLAYIVFLIFATQTRPSENDGSRVATIESLVERGTFAIDEASVQPRADRILVDGRFYSSKPPVLSFLASGVYWVLYNVFGLSFRQNRGLTYRLLTLSVVGSTTIILLYLFHRALEFTDLRESDRLFLTFSLGAATLVLPYSLALNNHTIAGALIFTGFYCLLRIKFVIGNCKTNSFLAGFSTALSAAIDVPAGLMFLALFLAYLMMSKKTRKLTLFYVLGAVPPAVVYSILNMHVVGDLLPTPLHQELYHFPGSYWDNPDGADALNEPKHVYLLNTLFWYRGIFLYTPVLLFSFTGLIIAAKDRENTLRVEAAGVLAGAVIVLLFYVFYMRNYGGNCFGFRHFIAVTPLVFFFTAVAFKKLKGWGKTVFFTSVFASIMLNIPGLGSPWVVADPLIMLIVLVNSVILAYLITLARKLG